MLSGPGAGVMADGTALLLPVTGELGGPSVRGGKLSSGSCGSGSAVCPGGGGETPAAVGTAGGETGPAVKTWKGAGHRLQVMSQKAAMDGCVHAPLANCRNNRQCVSGSADVQTDWMKSTGLLSAIVQPACCERQGREWSIVYCRAVKDPCTSSSLHCPHLLGTGEV